MVLVLACHRSDRSYFRLWATMTISTTAREGRIVACCYVTQSHSRSLPSSPCCVPFVALFYEPDNVRPALVKSLPGALGTVMQLGRTSSDKAVAQGELLKVSRDSSLVRMRRRLPSLNRRHLITSE